MFRTFKRPFLSSKGLGHWLFYWRFAKVRVSILISPYYIAMSPKPCRSFFLPTIIAVVIILLNLGTRTSWLASKKENYFLFPLHTPVAFNWMQSILSPLPRQMLECGLGQFKWLPCLGSEMNEDQNGVKQGHPGCYLETFASKIPRLLCISFTYQKQGCPKNHNGPSPTSAIKMPSERRPASPDPLRSFPADPVDLQRVFKP